MGFGQTEGRIVFSALGEKDLANAKIFYRVNGIYGVRQMFVVKRRWGMRYPPRGDAALKHDKSAEAA